MICLGDCWAEYIFKNMMYLSNFVNSLLRYKYAAAEYLESGTVEKIPGQRGDFIGINTGVVLFNLTR